MKIETLSNGARLVKRYRKGRCYACVWSSDTTDKQIQSQMMMRDANFFPFNESTDEFAWGQGNGLATHFRK